MISTFSRPLVWLLVLLSFVSVAQAAVRPKDLPPRYRHWLTEEVNYIISSNERKEFLSLQTDTERDSFIKVFWAIRNPDPNSDVNTYKDEHYRRLAYANEHFGGISQQDGWRTDQGRIYIILGPPQQVVNYPLARNVRPIEIWFYQTPSRALPPYFNLLFYKRSLGEPYTLYSPYQDGPARLVSTLEAMNDQKRSLETLRKSLGDEVAKTSLCLIPGESVSLDDYSPSLSSDVLLSTIAGLPDNPLTQDELNLNRQTEHVTMSVLLGDRNMSLSYEVFRDDADRQTLSYLLATSTPDARLIGQRTDSSYYYDLTLRTTVTTAAGKPAYEQEDRLTGNLTAAQAEIAKKKRFAAEARIPLAPGTYTLVTTLTNNINHIAAQQHASVTVPPVNTKPVGISSLLVYKAPAAVPDPNGELPFSASRLRFTPRGAQTVTLSQGERLPLVFQLWLGPRDPASTAPDKIHLRYTYGAATTSSASPSVESEDIDAANSDKAGNLLTGKTLNTSSLDVGTYMLVVSATRAGSRESAYASMILHVQPPENFVDTWTAYGPHDPEGIAVDDLKRGMSAEAQGADAAAQTWYSMALKESSSDLRPLDKLAALLIRQRQIAELAALGKQPILSRTAAAPGTLLAIANAQRVTGGSKAEEQLLEAQIKMQPPNADLYRTLADACEATGNNARARDLRSLAAGVK